MSSDTGSLKNLPTMPGIAVAMMGVLDRAGEPMSLEELSEEIGVSEQCIFDSINYVQTPGELDATLTDDGETALTVVGDE